MPERNVTLVCAGLGNLHYHPDCAVCTWHMLHLNAFITGCALVGVFCFDVVGGVRLILDLLCHSVSSVGPECKKEM